MRKKGEITVFLSLVIVCIMSLILGLLESARTTGARLYSQMAADSAMASVMSHYNKNLWEQYHLLFLEAESEEAVEQTFSDYLEFYVQQENMYPMQLDMVKVTKMTDIMEDGGAGLEDGALSYVKYRLPDVAGDLAGIAEDAGNAAEAGSFQDFFDICRQAGRKTRNLEKSRRKVEESLLKMEELHSELLDAVHAESRGRAENLAGRLAKECGRFSGLVDTYEAEVEKISEYKKELEGEAEVYAGEGVAGDAEEELLQESLFIGLPVEGSSSVKDSSWSQAETIRVGCMDLELTAYEQVEDEAKKQLLSYREMEHVLERNEALLEEALDVLEEELYESVYVEVEVEIGESQVESGDGIVGAGNAGEGSSAETGQTGTILVEELVPIGPDWSAVKRILSQIEIPGTRTETMIDWEKLSLLDQLEALFQGELLKLVLPQGFEVSRKSISLNGIPSKDMPKEEQSAGNVVTRFMVNEYCFLHFDSFAGPCAGNGDADGGMNEAVSGTANGRALSYELEYLLCGNASDRENLAETVEKLLTVRGAMNLLYLLSAPERKAEADALAASVTGGSVPFGMVLSFFILTMWAFGEAIWDVKQLMNGGCVPFWKDAQRWRLELEELLAFKFMDPVPTNKREGKDYLDHMRILFFLMDRVERNFRMVDVIQWNMRTVQGDFAVEDCYCEVEISAEILEKHLFFVKDAYARKVSTTGSY